MESFYITAFTDHLSLERRLSLATAKSYAYDLYFFLNYIQEIYGEEAIEEATPAMVRSWLADGAESGLESRTLNRRVSALRTFFSFLMQIKAVEMSPMVLISGFKLKKRIVRSLSKGEAEALLNPALYEDGFVGVRNRLVILTFYTLGIRRAELLSLTIKSIDLSQGIVRIVGKRNKERHLPLLPEWSQEAMKYMQLCDSMNRSLQEAFFIEENGKKMSRHRVYSIVHSYLQEVSSSEKASPHVLRHTFATHLMDMGADLSSIRSLLGHASLAATQVYTHASIEQLKKIVQRTHPRGRGE